MRKCCLLLTICLILFIPTTSMSFAQTPMASLQIGHLAKDVRAVDVYLGDELLFENVQPAEITTFERVAAGEYELSFFESGRDNQLAARTVITLEPDSWTFVPLFGSYEEALVGATGQRLNIDSIPRDQARMYFYNALDDTTMDIYVGGEVFDTLAAGALQVRDLPAGQQNVAIWSGATGETVLLDLTQGTFAPYELYMVTLTRVEGGEVATVAVTPLAAEIRIHHFVPDLPPLTLRANGEIVYEPASYARRDAVVNLPAGIYDLQLETHNVENPDVYFEARGVEILPTSHFILEIDGVMQVGNVEVGLTEVEPPAVTPENAFVTLLHRLTNTEPIDVRTSDGLVLIHGLAFRDGQATLDLPAGTYDLQITLSDGAILYDLDAVELNGGARYTFAVIGRFNDIESGRQPLFVTIE